MAYRDIVATIGTYEKDGQKKYITRKVGTLLETDKGLRIKLDACFNPAGCKIDAEGSIWLAAFDPKPRQEAVDQARQQPAHTQKNQANIPPFFDDAMPDF